MNERVAISPDDLWVMILATVRYSMGRRTYMSSLTKDLVLRYVDGLTNAHLWQIAAEVERELDSAKRAGRTLGDQCDEDHWRELVAKLRARGPT